MGQADGDLEDDVGQLDDDVVRGKKLVSKVYSKRGPYSSVTLTVRQRKNK